MRLFGMSLKSSSAPRHTGPSVKVEPAGDALDGGVGGDEIVESGVARFQRGHVVSSIRDVRDERPGGL